MDFQQFNDTCLNFFQTKQMDGKADNLKDVFIFEPCTRKTGGKRKDFFDGLQLNYYLKDGVFEISEYQAGKEANELHVYKETKSLKIALKDLLKGNKRKPIKIWK